MRDRLTEFFQGFREDGVALRRQGTLFWALVYWEFPWLHAVLVNWERADSERLAFSLVILIFNTWAIRWIWWDGK